MSTNNGATNDNGADNIPSKSHYSGASLVISAAMISALIDSINRKRIHNCFSLITACL